MRRETWLAISGVVVVVAVLGALFWQPRLASPPPVASPVAPALSTPLPRVTAIPSPATAVPATATAVPAPVSSAALPPLTADSTGLITLDDGLGLALPQEWQGAHHPNPAALGLADPNSTPLLAAWQGAADYLAAPMRITLIRTPRAGIALPVYLDSLVATLQATPGFHVMTQTITTTLRNDGLPAGALSYAVESAGVRHYGRQAALIDASGDNLLLLTLIAPAEQVAEADAQFRTLVASIIFEE